MPSQELQFKALWDDAIFKYEKSTSRALSGSVTLIKQLESSQKLAEYCEKEHENFLEFRKRRALATRLNKVAKPIMAASAVVQSAVGLSPFAPASVIFGATVYLVQATKGVSDAYDWIDDLFGMLAEFTVLLDQYCEGNLHLNLHEKIIESLVCLLEILALAEHAVRQGRWKKYAKVVFFGKDDLVKASFDRLAKISMAFERRVRAVNFATTQRIEKSNDKILRGVNEIREASKKAENERLWNWISPTNFRDEQDKLLPNTENNPGQWFLDSLEFNRWIGGPKHTLFCPGMPGAGKTRMAAITIHHLLDQVLNETNGVAFLYCSYDMPVDEDANTLLSALLRQLVELIPQPPENISRLYDQKSKRHSKLPSQDVFSTLQSVLKQYSKVYVVIDALDECRDTRGTRPRLLERLHSLQSEADLRLMITSRFTEEVEEEGFDQVSKLEVRASDEDVKQFVARQIHRLPKAFRLNEDLWRSVQSRISDATHGMFLLARLLIDLLAEQTNQEEVESELAKVSWDPKDATEPSQLYKQVYDGVIKRIDDKSAKKKELAKKVLSWMIYARRQLKISELRHALSVESGQRSLSNKSIPDIDLIVSVCAGLVTVDKKSNIIQLAHHTIREYLKQERLQWMSGAQEIATACLTYLSFDTFRSGSCTNDEAFEQRLAKNAFFDYSARYWSEHVRPVETCTASLALDFLLCDGLIQSTSQSALRPDYIYPEYSQDFPGQLSGLHLTTRDGLLHLTGKLLEESNFGLDADLKDNCGRTPLMYAAESGHEAVVKLLLEAKADVESKDDDGRTPLSNAAENGHEGVVKLLLEAKADVNSKVRYDDRTPLSLASGNGHEAVVKLLLEAKADVNSKDYQGTPLIYAVKNGHETVVKLLLEAKADIESIGGYSGSRMPLSLASENGYEAVVKLLLEFKADVHVNDTTHRMPLSWAAANGHEGVVKLLLEAKADVNSKVRYDDRTPLSLASENGHEAVVKLLLEAKADVRMRDYSYGTPLSWAAKNGLEAIVKLLLEAKADVKSKDNCGKTPLSRAAENGHEAVVKLLLEAKADVELEDHFGKTPLFSAAENGHEAVVKLLLEAKADVDSKDVSNGRTPLLRAARNGHEAVVKLLLEAKADIEWKEGLFNLTPLMYAAGFGHEAVVKLLLEAKADVESKDNNGRTPLSNAAENGYKTIAKLLLEAKADVESKDNNGRTPLSWAAESGREVIVKLLLETKADVEVKDNGRTPLSWAAEC